MTEDMVVEWAGRRESGTPTDLERQFAACLVAARPELELYFRLQEDPNGPWMLVTLDFIIGGAIGKTRRLDVDETGMRGGWSPGLLNWDECIRAADAGISSDPPDGISVNASSHSIEELAELAAAWFDRPSA